MTDNNGEKKRTTLQVSRPSKLQLTKTVEGGKVKQNFQRGRSKTVTVEVRRTRTFTSDDSGDLVEVKKQRSAHIFKKDSDGGIGSGIGDDGLTDEERQARLQALQSVDDVGALKAPPPVPKMPKKEDAGVSASRKKEDPAAKSAKGMMPPVDIPDMRRAEGAAAKGGERATKTDEKQDEKGKQKSKAKVKREAPRRSAGKLTINQALSMGEERMRSLASIKRQREKAKKTTGGAGAAKKETEKVIREVVIPESITVQELANRMAERSADVVKELMKLGSMVTVTQTIDADTAELIVQEFGHSFRRVTEADVERVLDNDNDEEENPENLKPRPPVVTIMGHVDHGKTSLLDALRKTDVVGGEAGGITQHIGAYQLHLDDGKKITFLDTPGHEAFSAMRVRGAQTTDIVVLVVAADDGIMEQTKEAISHAKAAEVPIIVAINKIDKPDADPDRVKNELMNYELVPEEFGGDVITVGVSAVEGTGLNNLQEAILLQAEMLELKANPDRNAAGAVLEARMEPGRGTVASLLVQKGTLRVGEIIVAGASYGKIRAMLDDCGNNIKEAVPSTPVEVLGLNNPPEAGDTFNVVENEKTARDITDYRKKQLKKQTAQPVRSLDQMFAASNSERKDLAIIIKADVHGSVEAISQSLLKLESDEVAVKILHSGVGGISESDINLAKTGGAIIIGFNVRAGAQARNLADKEQIDIRYYSVIYDLVDDVKAALSGLLSPERKENIIGYAEIRQVFNVSKVGKVAGCMVTEGVVRRGANVRLLRDDVVIHDGTLKTLKRVKDDAKEVKQGLECGMAFENYDDIQEGDVIEAYEVEEIARTI